MIQEISDILNSRKREISSNKGLVPAAILIPLLYKANELHILFTKRSQLVEHHKGEISFPGGTVDESDNSLLECALRECHEEIGLNEKDVQILGMLDDFKTVVTHFIITPYVGYIPFPYPFQMSVHEIDEILIIPISALINSSNYEQKPIVSSDGKTYHLDYFYYQNHTIWGATGFILKQFLQLVFQFPAQPL